MDGEVIKIPRETIMEILRDGCRAPSGDNTQPWRFEIDNGIVRVLDASSPTESIFNYKHMVEHVSIGACIENILISATARNLSSTVELFPNPENLSLVAIIKLVANSAELRKERDTLAEYIPLRISNRNKYFQKQIDPEYLQSLEKASEGSQTRVVFHSDPANIELIAGLVSTGEQLVISNRLIHDSFFSHITWTKEEDERKHGFYIETFEFTLVQKRLFKIFSNWKVLRYFLPLGIATLIARDAASVHKTAPVFGALLMRHRTPMAYVEAGRIFERLWLKATQYGLALQPTTGLNFFAVAVTDNRACELTKKQAALVRSSYGQLSTVFGAKSYETIAVVFKLGYAEEPSARTTRFEPVVELMLPQKRGSTPQGL